MAKKEDMTAVKSDMVASLAFNGLCAKDVKHKQWYLEKILSVVKTPDEIQKMKCYDPEKKDYVYDWDEGTPP